MAREERAHLRAVFLVEHRTGDVGDPPAGLEQRHGAVEDFGLLLLPLLQRAGPHAPFGVRIAPPGAGAGAGRVDQHQVAAAWQIVDVRRRPTSACAPARCARPSAPGGRGSAPSRRLSSSVAKIWPLFSIIAASAKRLAAGAGAEIDHLLARLGAGKQRGQLRAFVLHLDHAFEESGLGMDRRALGVGGQAACAGPKATSAPAPASRSDSMRGGLVARPPSAC